MHRKEEEEEEKKRKRVNQRVGKRKSVGVKLM